MRTSEWTVMWVWEVLPGAGYRFLLSLVWCHKPGSFHFNWSFPHYFFTPGRHTVFCGAHQPRQVWCAGLLKGQNPSRLPREFRRQVSTSAAGRTCQLRGVSERPSQLSRDRLHAGFISAFIKCDCALVWWQEFQRERRSCGKLLGSKMRLQDMPGETRAGTGLGVSDHGLWRHWVGFCLCICTFSVVLVNLSSWAVITSLLV